MSLRKGEKLRARFRAASRSAFSTGVELTSVRRAFGTSSETSKPVGRSLPTMDTERRSNGASDISMDRRIIRVDVPPAHAGITAALRRAFSPANDDPCERDFDELLRRLN
jgi:hypothetical protein